MKINKTEQQHRRNLMFAIGRAVTEVCEKEGISRAALERLTTEQGHGTIASAALLIEGDWLMEQSRDEGRIERSPIQATDQRKIMIVPDIDAKALIAHVKKVSPTIAFEECYEEWNVWKSVDRRLISGRGETLEFLTWKPGKTTSYEEVRKYFRGRGFYGNAGAFIAWIQQQGLLGHWGSVPEDSGCLSSRSGLFFPTCYFNSHGRRCFGTHWMGQSLISGPSQFVAFRQLDDGVS